ncbi:N-acetyltransferase B complex non catalytic subunit-domain-containing protein [Xylaria palmicola]|nr:N-acetyltransferase B complex non catalytic subunit-domain-containing protein [Xylaria palmicola]
MMSPRIAPAPRMVQLKRTVDVQLDHAFHEQQWTVAANLARQRHKTTKDDYYKAVEIAAKAHGDNATDRTIGIEVLNAMVSENSVIKDPDALDLYEFAVEGLPVDYAKTLGVLRARLAKALPKDQTAGLKCLDACMRNSDWQNAQEIAVSLNKNFPGDRKFLFHNILTTFLVAAAENIHENKRKLFSNLAKAQADRAFSLRPVIGKDQNTQSKLEISENEVKLWITIREKFGSAEENARILSLPNWGPLFFLERGFTDAFLSSIKLLASNEQWDEIMKVVNAIFDKVIAIGEQNQATIETTNGLGQKDEQYMNASREWFLWTNAVTATRRMSNEHEALKIFYKKIKKVICVLESHRRMNPVFQQNYDQILLDITFRQAATSTGPLSDVSDDNTKIQHLLRLAKTNLKNSNCFVMLKGFLELLSREEVANFVTAFGDENTVDTEGLDKFDKFLFIALRFRVRFFQATSLNASEECRFCHSVANDGPDCDACLKSIAEGALRAFNAGVQDEAVSKKAANESEDPLSNLAVLGSICLIKLAGAGRKNLQYMTESPLCHVDIQLFLQAVIWLDFYLRKTPKNDSLRLLLVKLYLTMGCVTRALQVWSTFGVKNTLLECLGTVCLDRLASISPSHFITGPSNLRNFAEPFLIHFETAIQKRYPETVSKTFQNNSYAELVNVIELAENQSRNCVSILAVVERRRGLRFKSGRTEDPIEDEPLVGSLSPEYELKDFTDYNPLPHWAGVESAPIQELVAYGPLPTNRRCHLSVLAERFLDLACYVHPKDVKPTKAGLLLQLDWQAAAVSSQSLHENLATLLYDEDHAENDLTGAENWYFSTVTELADLVKLILETVLLTASTRAAKEGILAIVRRVLTILEHQTQDFLAVPDGIPAKMDTLHGMAGLHAMGMLHESALAVRNAALHVNAALDRLKAAEKTRGAAEANWLAPEIKRLAAAAASADARIRARVKKLTEDLHASGWVDRLAGWALAAGDEAAAAAADGGSRSAGFARGLALFVPPAAREVWAADVADSWRDAVKGWGAVRLD